MENSVPPSNSIFDIIEERSDSPEEFVWSTNPALFICNTELIIFEGELVTLSGDSHKMRSRRYVLTLNALIKYKVRTYARWNRGQIRRSPRKH